MRKRGGSEARDCLYLNWAIPGERMPEPSAPLRYDVRDGLVLASTVLFRLHRTGTLGLLAPGHPQLDLHVCALDEEGGPCFLMQCVLIPSWALPGARRLVALQPAHTASFDYPALEARGGERIWRVKRRARLEVAAHESGPSAPRAPDLGSWEQTVTFFQNRSHGYFPSAEGLRRVEVSRRQVQVVPMAVEIVDQGLVERCLSLRSGPGAPELHSAWFCPEVPFAFERHVAPAVLPKRLPAPG